MRTLALVLPVALICLAGGYYAGSATCERARAASAQQALRRATEAVAVGRLDEALQYAFAALDRDPELYAAYELAGDALATQQQDNLRRHFYLAALSGIGTGRTAHAAEESSSLPQRARLEAKIAALDRNL
jgi:hypothetical protein